MQIRRYILLSLILAIAAMTSAQTVSVGVEQPVTIPEPIPVRDSLAFPTATNGDVTLLEDLRGGVMRVTVIDAAGRTLRSRVVVASNVKWASSMLWFAGRFVLIWSRDNFATLITEVSPTGEIGATIALSHPRFLSFAVAGPHRLMLLGYDVGSSETDRTWDGLLLDADLNITAAINKPLDFEATAVASGEDFLVFEHTSCGQAACPTNISRVDATGHVTPAGSYTGVRTFPVMAADHIFSVWVEHQTDLVVAVFSPQGEVVVSPHVAFRRELSNADDFGITIESMAATPTGLAVVLGVAWEAPALVTLDATGAVTSRRALTMNWPPPAAIRSRPLRRDEMLPGPPWILSAEGHLLAVWGTGGGEVAAPMSYSGQILSEPLPVGYGIPNQATHDVASAGTSALVVWVERDTVGENYSLMPHVRGGRIASDGSLLDPSGFLIHDHADRPAVAFDGEQYVVAWVDDTGEIWFSRVSLDGAVGSAVHVEESAQVEIQYSRRPLSIACVTGSCLLTWTSLYGDRAVHGIMIEHADAGPVFSVSSPAPYDPFSGNTEYKVNADVAASPDQFLVTWNHYCCLAWNPSAVDAIDATRVTRTGLVLDPGEITMTAGGWNADPTSAWTGYAYLSLWSRDDTTWPPEARDPALTPEQIFGKEIAADGTVLDSSSQLGITVSTAPGRQIFPTIACRSMCLAVWEDHREHPGYTYPNPADIYGTVISAAGSVLNPDGVSIAASDESEEEPRVVPIGDSDFLVVYSRTSADPNIDGATRIYSRIVAQRTAQAKLHAR